MKGNNTINKTELINTMIYLYSYLKKHNKTRTQTRRSRTKYLFPFEYTRIVKE